MADDASDLRGAPADTAHCLLDEVVGYRAGDLSPERMLDFEAHLRGCPACRRLVWEASRILSGVDLVVRAAGSRERELDSLLARLRRRVAERSVDGGPRQRQPSQRFWLPMAGVAAVVTLVAVLQLVMVLMPRLWRKPAAVMPAAAAVVGPSP